MNQEKIGKFIADLRKEKGLTQENLAEKLGVSKNAVSKWEHGICLLDMALLKPVCATLNISVNELLSGKKIKTEDINEKFEENLVNTIEYTHKKINAKNKVIKCLIISFILVLFLLALLFIIDINRMRNNKPVFFSTWGLDYAPPVDLSEEKINRAVEEYLAYENESKYHENAHTFVSMETYLIEDKNEKVLLYAWALIRTYYEEGKEIIQDSGSSIPYKFILKKYQDSYTVISLQIPRDGSYYEDDMKRIFPRSVLKKMNKVHTNGTIERLTFDIERQKDNYYNR